MASGSLTFKNLLFFILWFDPQDKIVHHFSAYMRYFQVIHMPCNIELIYIKNIYLQTSLNDYGYIYLF